MRIFRFFPIIGLVLFLFIIFSVGIENILSSLFRANIFFIILAFLFFLPVVFLQIFKWSLLLKYQGIKLPFSFLSKVFLISSFYAAITPGKLGSFIRIPYIRKKSKKSLLDCSINVLTDRALDVFSIFFIALFGLVFLPFFTELSDIFYIFMPVILVFGLLILFLFKKNLSEILNFLYNLIVPEKFKQKNLSIKSELLPMDNFSFLKILLLSILAQLLVLIQAYFVALSFGIFIPLHFFILLVAFSSIIVFVPISIQGIGAREAVLLYFFSFFSVEPSKTIVFSISTLIILYIFVLVFGGYFSFRENL